MADSLRGDRENLIKEGRLKKYVLYALGEVLLLVVGIFIAVEINNLKEEMTLNEQESVFLTHMHEDFKENEQLILQGIADHQSCLDYLHFSLKHTGAEVEVPSQLVLDSIQNIRFATIGFVYGSEPLYSESQLDLLNSTELRSLLTTFLGDVSIYKTYETANKNLAIRQRGIHQKHVSILAMEPDLHFSNNKPHNSDFKGWLQDRDYQNTLVDRILQEKNAMEYLAELNAKNKLILDLVRKELKRSK